MEVMLRVFVAAAKALSPCVPFSNGIKSRHVAVTKIGVWLKCLFMVIVTRVY